MNIILAIVLAIFVIYVLVTYWKFILALTIVSLLSILAISFLYHKATLAKIANIKNSKVIFIPSQTIYSIPIEVEKKSREISKTTPKGTKKSQITEWIVKSIYPELKNGNLQFVSLDSELTKVEIIKKELNNLDYKISQEISQFVKEVILELDPRIEQLKKQIDELNRLKDLVLGSKIHADNAQRHEKGILERQESLSAVKEAKAICYEIIKEKLIEKELTKADPDELLDTEWKVEFDIKHRARQEQYQIYKDQIKAYIELRENSKI
jgi:hypothetical protein